MLKPHHIKLIEITIQYLQFMTSIFLIILSATGVAFYFFWADKSQKKQIGNLWPFALPAGIVLVTFIFIANLYKLLINGLAGPKGITSYMGFWFSYVGYVLWPALFLTIILLIIALIKVSKKVK